MAQFQAAPYTELRPELTWDKLGGWTTTRTFHGIYTSLKSLADNLFVVDASKGLWSLDLSDPDPKGYAVLKALYSTEIIYQWSKTSNTLENSIYLGESRTKFVKDLSGTPDEQSSIYNRLVNGIEAAHRKGLTWTDLQTGIIDEKVYTTEVSESVRKFRIAYGTLTQNVDQKPFIQSIYTLRLKDIETYQISQVVLRNTFTFGSYDQSINLYSTLINTAWTKTAIINKFGGAGSPIPDIIKNSMPENYWFYVGEQTDLLNTGKIQTTVEWWYMPAYETLLYGPPVAT